MVDFVLHIIIEMKVSAQILFFLVTSLHLAVNFSRNRYPDLEETRINEEEEEEEIYKNEIVYTLTEFTHALRIRYIPDTFVMLFQAAYVCVVCDSTSANSR